MSDGHLARARVVATVAPFRLPLALARAVVLSDGSTLLVAGAVLHVSVLLVAAARGLLAVQLLEPLAGPRLETGFTF